MKAMFGCFSEMNHRDELFPHGCLLFRYVVAPEFTAYFLFYIKDNDDWFDVEVMWTEHSSLPAVIHTPGLNSPPTNKSHALHLPAVINEKRGGLMAWHLATTPFLGVPPYPWEMEEVEVSLLLPRVDDAVADCLALITSHGIDYLRRATIAHGLAPTWLDQCG